MFDRLKQGWTSFMTLVTPGENSAGWRRAILTGMGFLIILILLVGMYWSNEPAEFDVRVNAGRSWPVQLSKPFPALSLPRP
jgi:hypothetical protein